MSGARPGAADWSIRRRLLLWLLIPLLLVSATLLLFNYVQARHTADDTFDRLLRASVLAIAERITVAAGEVEVDLPYVALEMLGSAAQDRVFYRIGRSGGAFVTGYADLPAPPRQASVDAPVFYDTVYRDEAVRVASLSRALAPWGLPDQVEVRLAQTRGERERLAQQLVLASALRLLLVVTLAVVIAGFAVAQGLQPLARLRRVLRSRPPDDLGPIIEPAPQEVRELVEAINHLMARLQQNLNAMQRFIADASHQLRTPLAALQAEAELCARAADPLAQRKALHGMMASTRRTSRLANQLLSLARAAPDGGVPARAPLDLAVLAADVTRDAVPAALARDIDLGFEGAAGPVPIEAEPLLVGELLKNLLDNAMRYCPPGAHITVRVTAAAQAVLEVEDDGPGISAEHRARVLERFYRIPGTPSEGSGLGLAIVGEIAARHDAALALLRGREDRGLCVRVAFPLAAPAVRA